MRRVVSVLMAAGAAATWPDAAWAQSALVLRADSLAGRGDTLRALVMLGEAVHSDGHDAAAWYRRGLLAWRLSRKGRGDSRTPWKSDGDLRGVADSSLRLATAYAPDSARYLVDFGRFLLASDWALTRGKADQYFERALAIARRTGDRAAAADALDQLGMSYWRRYDDIADRNIYSATLRDPKDSSLINDAQSFLYFLDNLQKRAASQRMSGEYEYLKATGYFADALRADPSHERALRHTFMALADRQRWEEMRHIAHARLRARPDDVWGWLGRALSSHRLRDDRDAALAFDSALAHMARADQRRFTRLSRLLSPEDSAAFAATPEGTAAAQERLYWLSADPMWLTPGNERRVEFLSRVTYAELRWTVDEYNLHGADTDRGEVYVRYGPPAAVISFPADPLREAEMRLRLLWWYRPGVAFLFRALPGYGLAAFADDDARLMRDLRRKVPVDWTPLLPERAPDSIGVRLARFRAAGDSTDVLIAAALPLERMLRDVDLRRGALRVDLQLFDGSARPIVHDSSRAVIDFAAARAVPRTRSWRARVAPGSFLFRVEALQPDAMHAARGGSLVGTERPTGFGLSDVVLADSVSPAEGSAAERWSDFVIAPNVGAVPRGRRLALLWETYGLATAGGVSRYRVSIALTRAPGGGGVARRLAAAIIGGVRSAVGRSARGDDRIVLAYDREVPARPAVADYLTLDLAEAPAGRYALSVEVVDLVTSKRVTRETAVTIVE
jgi:GWxTD domain-containing protein